MQGPLALRILAYPPDRRERDIDNIQKPLLDALEKANAYENDNQIKDLHTLMKKPLPGGKVWITLKRMESKP